MPGTERTGNDELHDSRWLGAILPIILGYLQLIPQQQRRQGEGGGEGNAAARFDSLIASSLSFTIALIALTASMPLPPSKGLKICIFHLILGFVVLLSSALPNMVRWLPYFSCIRPLFHLLPPRLQLRNLHFSQILWDAVRRYVAFLFHMLPRPFQLRILQFSESSLNVIRLLVTVDASPDAQSSPPAQANINLDMVEVLHDDMLLFILPFQAPSIVATGGIRSVNLRRNLSVTGFLLLDKSIDGIIGGNCLQACRWAYNRSP